jgi:hypothetical protein
MKKTYITKIKPMKSADPGGGGGTGCEPKV